jgi:murein DD-endopeptidase MepM/ murein hydrolase activator NlpD
MEYQTKTSLILPFNDIWVVGNGGRDPEKNNHYSSKSQKFAYDFSKPHKGEGVDLEDYEAFGSEVIAPGEGTISQVIDGSIDMPIGESDGFVAPGNMLVINHENGEWSVLAHFKYNSISVKNGDRVKQGDLLGLCGNTGRTTEPHIHYHLQDGPLMSQATGLPAQFSNIQIDGVVQKNIELEYGQEVLNC